MWILYALLSAIFGALTSITAKFALKELDSTFLTIIRSIIMAIFLIILGLALHKFDLANWHKFSISSVIALLLAALFGALSWLFYFMALKSGKVSFVYALDKLSIILIIIFASVFLGENLSLKSILGGVLLFIGVLMLR